MAVSTDVGLALLQAAAVLTASELIRGYCTRHLAPDLVPMVLLSRIQLCNRLAPLVWLIALAMGLTGALICLSP